jgi:hypothetical protein
MSTPLRLGKKAPRIDHRTLRLDKYTAALPSPPPRVDWTRGFNIDWGMMLNGPSSNPIVPDGVGDCTEAKKGHAVQVWSLCNGRMLTVPDSVVLAAYEADGGYIPGDPSTDNGEVMLDNLNDWRKNGFGSVALTAYAAINFSSLASVAQAIYLFGLVDIGFNVPQSAMDQFDAGQPWTVVANDGGIVGGHDVVVPGYNSAGDSLLAITWGRRQPMSWEFFAKYVDESYALLSPAWLTRGSVDPSGFDMAALQADLAAVTA